MGKLSCKTDTILALTALANVHSVVANALDHEDSHHKAVDAVVEIVSISDGFRGEDYNSLDSTLMVCAASLAVNGGSYGLIKMVCSFVRHIAMLERGSRDPGARARSSHRVRRGELWTSGRDTRSESLLPSEQPASVYESDEGNSSVYFCGTIAFSSVFILLCFRSFRTYTVHQDIYWSFNCYWVE